MNFKKITAAFLSAAAAVTMCAISVSAETIDLDLDYAGNWGAGNYIPKEDLEAIGGDVKITLNIETIEPQGEDQFLVTPMDYSATSWPRILDQCTSDTVIAKEDQFICLVQGEKTVEFVVPQDTIANLTEKDGVGGIGFQVCNVIVKSAEIEAGTPEKAYDIIDESNDNVIHYGLGELSREDVVKKSDAASPEADNQTATPTTGNTSVCIIISVMTVSIAAAIACRKSKKQD